MTKEVAKAPTLAQVKKELTAALGKPRSHVGLTCYPAPTSPAERKKWIARVYEAGGAAAISDTGSKGNELCVGTKPSQLFARIFNVSWRTKSALKAWDLLDADAGLRVTKVGYTDFTIALDRVPTKIADHAKRLAKADFMLDDKKIEAALKKRAWSHR